MQGIIRKYYPQKCSMVYFSFDLAFLLYLIAYFIYYQDEAGYERIRMVATVAMLAMGLLLCVVTKLRTISMHTIWYFLFILLGFFSIVWSEYDEQVTLVMPSLIRILILGVFLSVRIREKKDLENLLFYFVVSIVILNLHTGKLMIDYYSFSVFYLKRFGDQFLYNSNSIAILNVFASLIVLHWIKIADLAKKILPAIALMFFVVVLFLTGSKKGLIGFFFGMIVLFYQRAKGTKKLERIFIGIISVIAVLAVVVNTPLLYEIVGYRIDAFIDFIFKIDTGDTSSKIRMELIQYALHLWVEHPLLGVGINNFSMYQSIGSMDYYAHNNYVELLADLGMIGFLLYYSMLLYLLYKKINNKYDILVLMKTMIWVVLFLDIGVVAYQDIRVQLFICFAYVALVKQKNITSTRV